MRFFNVRQHQEPKSMFQGDRLIDFSEIEKTAFEITEEKANEIPNWGSGNISVDEKGSWAWMKTNHDTSG